MDVMICLKKMLTSGTRNYDNSVVFYVSVLAINTQMGERDEMTIYGYEKWICIIF